MVERAIQHGLVFFGRAAWGAGFAAGREIRA